MRFLLKIIYAVRESKDENRTIEKQSVHLSNQS